MRIICAIVSLCIAHSLYSMQQPNWNIWEQALKSDQEVSTRQLRTSVETLLSITTHNKTLHELQSLQGLYQETITRLNNYQQQATAIQQSYKLTTIAQQIGQWTGYIGGLFVMQYFLRSSINKINTSFLLKAGALSALSYISSLYLKHMVIKKHIENACTVKYLSETLVKQAKSHQQRYLNTASSEQTTT